MFEKIVERLIFNSLFEYLEKYKLLLSHQSGFQANDPCVDQLLSILHNIYTALDAYSTLECCGVFLDMSKALDKVWNEKFLFKLKSMGICNVLLDLIGSFLENRFQSVVLNAQTSEWLLDKAEVPQGSI